MMSKVVGRLKVIREVGRDGRGEALWLCECSCGNTKVVRGSQLRKGLVSSCGCYQREFQMKDLAGQKFGRLLVLERGKRLGKSGVYHWRCQCDCGRHVFIRGSCLTSNSTQSCGCLNDEKRKAQAADLVGQRFGRLVVEERAGSKNGAALWISVCDCGNIVVCATADLRRGSTTSCGCFNRQRSSEAHRGSRNVNYNPALTDEDRLAHRDLTANKTWVKQVLSRDNYTCQVCGIRGGRTLVGHHLDGWHWAKDRRFDVSNGATLCIECHYIFHEFYGRRDNSEAQFKEFVYNFKTANKAHTATE